MDLSSLLMWWYLLLGNFLMCCKPFSANLSIILKEFLGFHPPCLEGFPKVYLVSDDWLIYMDDLWSWFMWLIYLWDLYVDDIFMWLIYSWYSYVADLWNTYVMKLIDKSFKVQASPILLKASTIPTHFFSIVEVRWVSSLGSHVVVPKEPCYPSQNLIIKLNQELIKFSERFN